MNAINRAAGSVLDVLLAPFEMLGDEWALVLVSGLFGILALVVFKHISWQGRIKGTKDKIKGNMIAIRIYQDDLAIVTKSVAKVFLRNFQYLGLNFGPLLPLFVPFVLVASQFVVRYGYEPLPVIERQEDVDALLPGQGTTLEVQLKRGRESEIAGLEFAFPAGVERVSPVVRSAEDGKAFVEVIARQSVSADVGLMIDGVTVGTKKIAAGTGRQRRMQPERVSSFWSSWLLPAEDTFPADSPIASVGFRYPDRELAYLPNGETGILIVFVLASIAFGLLVLKPLKIQI